ncbi:MAG: transposase [Brevefilum sp.]
MAHVTNPEQQDNCYYNFSMDAINQPLHERKNIRLVGFDYAQPGAYFVTIVTQGRACLFGEILAGEMHLNAAGVMIARVCAELPNHIPCMAWGIYQIMPNHFHAIIELMDEVDTQSSKPGQALLEECFAKPAPTRDQQFQIPTDGRQINSPTGEPPNRRTTLGDVVGRFKSLTTHRYIEGIHTKQWTPFARRLWQRNYYEHIIRDEKDYQAVYEYVLSNPQNWTDDPERPAY